MTQLMIYRCDAAGCKEWTDHLTSYWGVDLFDEDRPELGEVHTCPKHSGLLDVTAKRGKQ